MPFLDILNAAGTIKMGTMLSTEDTSGPAVVQSKWLLVPLMLLNVIIPIIDSMSGLEVTRRSGASVSRGIRSRR